MNAVEERNDMVDLDLGISIGYTCTQKSLKSILVTFNSKDLQGQTFSWRFILISL